MPSGYDIERMPVLFIPGRRPALILSALILSALVPVGTRSRRHSIMSALAVRALARTHRQSVDRPS
jgi:hypothetical protein